MIGYVYMSYDQVLRKKTPEGICQLIFEGLVLFIQGILTTFPILTMTPWKILSFLSQLGMITE